MDKKGKEVPEASAALPADIGQKKGQNEAEPSEVAEEGKMEQRIEKLLDKLRAERSSTRITNASFERGRPKLTPTEDMRFDPANLYSRFSIDQLYAIKPRAVSNNMATTEDMARIFAAIEGAGVPTEQVSTVIVKAVIYCKSTSSSQFLDPTGTFEYRGGAIMADSVLAIMKRDANTLRRVCRLYAPIVWNHMLLHNDPPSDWQAMGFQHGERFAAFDFFDYVENQAAIQPTEGLIRRPTPAEKIAHATHKRIALDAANRNAHLMSVETEITGGVLGPEIVRNFKNSSNSR